MSYGVDQLFRLARESCSPAQWSRGVELSRSGSVYLESEEEDEVVFRVAVGSSVAGRTLRIFLDDGEWDCGCDSPEDGCEHVAAAMIVWKRAGQPSEIARSCASRNIMKWLTRSSRDSIWP